MLWDEMLDAIKKIFPEFDTIKKTILITHADVNHCGLLPMFDEIIVSHKTALCLKMRIKGRADIPRERLC